MMHLVAGCAMEASYGILSKEHELPWGLYKGMFNNTQGQLDIATTNINI
jgi:hypothetical protein